MRETLETRTFRPRLEGNPTLQSQSGSFAWYATNAAYVNPGPLGQSCLPTIAVDLSRLHIYWDLPLFEQYRNHPTFTLEQ
jgi:hypothetical protein